MYGTVYVVFYKDVAQLNDLIDALYDDGHLIIVHMGEPASALHLAIDAQAAIVQLRTIVYCNRLSLIN